MQNGYGAAKLNNISATHNKQSVRNVRDDLQVVRGEQHRKSAARAKSSAGKPQSEQVS